MNIAPPSHFRAGQVAIQQQPGVADRMTQFGSRRRGQALDAAAIAMVQAANTLPKRVCRV